MELHGNNIIGGRPSALGTKTFFALNPREGKQLQPQFHEAASDEVDRAMELAEAACPELRSISSAKLAAFLEDIASEIEALGDALVDQAALESGLTKDRLTGERARTTTQLRLFAGLVKEGSFVDARIDTALPDRKPMPRPDLRRMLRPIGPVVVFGASNFPLAFSVAGGDTASALATRNPVVFKAHPAHPGTSELVAGAIVRAVEKAGLPAGVFSLIHAIDPPVSLQMVRHPAAKAVAFTGSERAGRAIFDAAAQRPVPIPAYVEMGSINPVFVLPGALKNSADSIAQGLFNSINLGVGQFCTCPGVVIGQQNDHFGALREKLVSAFHDAAPGTMLYPKVLQGYRAAVEHVEKTPGVRFYPTSKPSDEHRTEASPVLFETDAETWLAREDLRSEVFGPSSILVNCTNPVELIAVAKSMPGTLTATVHGTPEDLQEYRELIEVLETKAGRLLFNGYPTGVEVSPAMHHGGPYPATADEKFTSVGTASVYRFLRPVCFQNFPEQSLPPELRNANPLGIWRTVNGNLTKETVEQVKGV